jgi:TonB family protein
VGGRFTIFAYFLEDVDARLALPEEPGRVLLLVFRDANGNGSFLIPGDLALEDGRGGKLTVGLTPLGEGRLAGFLDKNDVRRALWWVPRSRGEWGWTSPEELRLVYGFDAGPFLPLDSADRDKVAGRIPWGRLDEASLDPEADVHRLEWTPDPHAFDQMPEIKTMKEPEYPRAARQYDLRGTVRVVARVNESGTVDDAFVVQTAAAHQLKVAALVAVKKWVFRPGRRNNRKVAGDVLIPILFAEKENR